jgi:hypothetical protein
MIARKAQGRCGREIGNVPCSKIRKKERRKEKGKKTFSDGCAMSMLCHLPPSS